MLTINLNDAIEHELNSLARRTNKTIEQVIANALTLYAEQQEDMDCLAVIAEREQEATISYDDVLAGLKKDGLV